MSYSTIAGWDAPTGAALSGVSVGDVGMVVCVRIAPKAGNTLLLGPAADGSCPHVVYSPDRAPDGTTAMQEYDSMTGLGGQIVGPKPRVIQASSFSKRQRAYRIDLGVPFQCPWPAAGWGIDGGATAGGIVSPQDVEVVSSVPLTSAIGRTVGLVDGSGRRAYDMSRRTYYTEGRPPLTPPTLTYRNVGVTPVEIPYGAVAIQVWAPCVVTFTDPNGATEDVTATPGAPLRLGSYQLGTTFQLPGGVAPPAPVQRLVFILEIA